MRTAWSATVTTRRLRAGDAEGQDGGVVVEHVAEPVEERSHGGDRIDSGRGGQLGQKPVQGLLVVARAMVDASLDEAVCVQQERVTGCQLQDCRGEEGG